MKSRSLLLFLAFPLLPACTSPDPGPSPYVVAMMNDIKQRNAELDARKAKFDAETEKERVRIAALPPPTGRSAYVPAPWLPSDGEVGNVQAARSWKDSMDRGSALEALHGIEYNTRSWR